MKKENVFKRINTLGGTAEGYLDYLNMTQKPATLYEYERWLRKLQGDLK